MNKVKVLFVCLGNICRSPLAEGIFRQRVKERGLEEYFLVDSCGTAAYHIGKSPDKRSIQNAGANGVDYTHAARQLNKSDFDKFDYILPMDDANLINTLELQTVTNEAEVVKMRYFDPINKGADVPDPYYGGADGFQEVFDILDRSIDVFLTHLMETYFGDTMGVII